MKKLFKLLKIEDKNDKYRIFESDQEKEVGIQKAFLTQFSENQNHSQRLFIQFLSSVLIVLAAFAFVYSNTAIRNGIKIINIDQNSNTNIKYDSIIAQKYDVIKDSKGSIISFSQMNLISIYVFAQVVLLILSIMILHIGYSFRRDQKIVQKIRNINLGAETYTKIFGRNNYSATNKGLFEFLPNFNSILFFSICVIQLILFTSMIISFDFYNDNEIFETFKETKLLPKYSVNYSNLKTSFVFPILINFFLYTYYYNKYEFSVNGQNTYVPLIKPFGKFDKYQKAFYFINILIMLLYFIFTFKHTLIPNFNFTILIYFLIILLPIITKNIKNEEHKLFKMQLFQSLIYFIGGLTLVTISYFDFKLTNNSKFINSLDHFLIPFLLISIFVITNWIMILFFNFTEKEFQIYLNGHNRFLIVLITMLALILILNLKWFDNLASIFFGVYSMLIGRRTFLYIRRKIKIEID